MNELQSQILAVISRKNYQPVKARALAGSLNVPKSAFEEFRSALRELIRQGRARLGKNATVQRVESFGTVTGVFRRHPSGDGVVRPSVVEQNPDGDVSVASPNTRDASTGDEVVVRLLRKPGRRDEPSVGEVIEILQRATQTFVGTYFERDGSSFVRVDGTVFSHS